MIKAKCIIEHLKERNAKAARMCCSCILQLGDGVGLKFEEPLGKSFCTIAAMLILVEITDLSGVIQEVTLKRMIWRVLASPGDLQEPTPRGSLRASVISGGAPGDKDGINWYHLREGCCTDLCLTSSNSPGPPSREPL